MPLHDISAIDTVEFKVVDTILLADAASFDITNIPVSPLYASLKVILQARATGAVTSALCQCRFNNDSGANYDYQYVLGNNVTASAATSAAGTSTSLGDVPGASATAGYAGAIESSIPNYGGTTFDKIVASRAALVTGTAVSTFFAELVAGHWRTVGTGINRLTVFPSSGSWKAGSRLSIVAEIVS